MGQLLAAYWNDLGVTMQVNVVSGIGLIEGDQECLFIPDLDNYYEQYLYEKVRDKVGIHRWQLHQFSQTRFKGHLDAVESAFNNAIKDAGLHRKINKKMSQRVGVIYFDMHGPVSYFQKDAQIKEMYYSDVFPSFLLNTHNISGYSVRLRGERNVGFEAIELANTLIDSGTLDVVIVGGVFQSNPYLFLSDALDDQKWAKDNYKMKAFEHDSLRNLQEASGFMVIESKASCEGRKLIPKLYLNDLSSNEPLELKDRNCQHVVGLFPDAVCHAGELNKLEKSVREKSFSFSDKYYDSGCINLIKVIRNHINEKDDDKMSNSICVHSIDRNGFDWHLQFN